MRALVACSRDLLVRPGVRPGRVALVGVSTGTTLSLLAAEEPDLADDVSVVDGLTGYTHLVDLIRLATTGTHRDRSLLCPYPTGLFLALWVARSVAAGLEAGPDRDALLAELEALPVDEPRPARVRPDAAAGAPPGRREGSAGPAPERRPRAHDELYAALPAPVRAAVERLWPVHGVSRLRAPVELLVDPRDKSFPPGQALALARAAADRADHGHRGARARRRAHLAAPSRRAAPRRRRHARPARRPFRLKYVAAGGRPRSFAMSMYAIISLGGKQYRVQQGQRLLVDRLPYEESKTFHPPVLFVGGDGQAELAPKSVQVTAKVVANVLGDKIRIGKYRRRTGYRRHTGHRSRLSQVEITAIGAKAASRRAAAKDEAPAAEAAEEKPKRTAPRRAPAKSGAEAVKGE